MSCRGGDAVELWHGEVFGGIGFEFFEAADGTEVVSGAGVVEVAGSTGGINSHAADGVLGAGRGRRGMRMRAARDWERIGRFVVGVAVVWHDQSILDDSGLQGVRGTRQGGGGRNPPA